MPPQQQSHPPQQQLQQRPLQPQQQRQQQSPQLQSRQPIPSQMVPRGSTVGSTVIPATNSAVPGGARPMMPTARPSAGYGQPMAQAMPAGGMQFPGARPPMTYARR